MRIMPNPPAGDPKELSDDLIVEGLYHVQLLGIFLGLSSRDRGAWVGVSVQEIAVVTGEPGVTFPLMHPVAWLSLNANNRVAIAVRVALAEQLITLEDGFAYPTQKLVDQLLAASS